jgi:hypothetical protein
MWSSFPSAQSDFRAPSDFRLPLQFKWRSLISTGPKAVIPSVARNLSVSLSFRATDCARPTPPRISVRCLHEHKKTEQFRPARKMPLVTYTLILLYFFSSDPLILLRRRKPHQCLSFRRPLHLHPHQRFSLRTRFPQRRHRTQRLRIHSRHQISIGSPILLPQLPNLYFRYALCHHLDSIGPIHQCQPLARSAL